MVWRAWRTLALGTVLASTALAQSAPAPIGPGLPEAIVSTLSGVSLSDRENGEILGTALDLVERPEVPDRQPGADATLAAHRVGVVLAPGALDKLRRSSEFRRLAPGHGQAAEAGAVYVRDEAPAIRVIVTADLARAVIEVARRP